jgi:5-methylcytosine-specific restriction enzyme subunit McrC
MDYIFEDFVAGFIEKHFSQKWKVEYQKSEMYLAQNEEKRNVFQMQHDIFLTNRSNSDIKIIVDTKYKLRNELLNADSKRGIVQSDMYQMVSYAFRRGCKNVILIYPNSSEEIKLADNFIIESGFNRNDKINVIAVDFPFWTINRFENIEILMINALNRLLSTFEK